MYDPLILAILFFVIAYVYSSVGFGGGSSYLAVLSLMGVPFADMRFTALICNVIVVIGGVLLFIRHNQLDWRKALPLVCASVPASFLGARMKISEHTFFIWLGISLITAAGLLWFQPGQRAEHSERSQPSPVREVMIGGGIGWLSGMVGIGGGIFLSPLLNLMKWDDSRKIAATASFFILLNSVAGLAGLAGHLPAQLDAGRTTLLAVMVLAGGQLGARASMRRFELGTIRRVTAVVVFIAGAEVLYRHLIAS